MLGILLTRSNSTAEDVKEWELQEVNDVPHWNRGRAIMIGDAAHAMTPLQGQGANMAIEDAESLILLANASRGEVESILERVAAARKQRVAEITVENRAAGASKDSVGARLAKNRDLYYGYQGIHSYVATK